MRAALFVLAMLAGACSTVEIPASDGVAGAPATPAGQVDATVIGSSCEAGDGWQPSAGGETSDGGAPTAIAVPEGYLDTPDLPPGVVYCLEPGGVFPNGYLTSNCSKHSDCPSGTLCDDVHCRLPCDADAECTLPSTCGVPAGKLQVRFCSCAGCVANTGR